MKMIQIPGVEFPVSQFCLGCAYLGSRESEELSFEIMDYYYSEDLSLSEVSALTGITRQGVRDAIRRSEKLLSETEEKLGLVARFSAQKEDLRYIVCRLEEIQKRGEAVDDIISRARKLL